MKKAITLSILTIFSVFGCIDPELEADDMDVLAEGVESGLKGQYFNNMDFTSPVLERVDSSINFDWGRGSPHSKIDPDTFSVRWTGFVTAKHSQTYTFYTIGDDGIRLYVDNKLVVNDWSNHGARERSGTIALKAGQSYPIKLEYYESTGGAVAKLLWSSPSQAKQIIPATQLKTALADGTIDEPNKGTREIRKIEDLDAMAAFSFSIFGDNNGMAARNHDEFGDIRALGMSRLEKWIKANDKFVLGVGDHAIGTRKYWIWQTEKDSFWNNHYYPAVGDNCNETDYFYGKTADQASWGRGWVMYKALNNFFKRSTSVDKIVFRQPESTPVYSSKSKAEPNKLVPYPDQLVDYHVTRKQGRFNIHIIVVHYASPGVLAARSKDFMMNRLRSLSPIKTNYDIIVVVAQRASFLQAAQSGGHMTRAERDSVMKIADLVVCGDSHIYARQNMFDKDYDGKEALFMNSGSPYQTGALWGYLNVHVFDNPPRFTVQYIDVQFKNARQLHVDPVRRSSTQKALPEEAVSPVLKVVNGPRSRIDWKKFQQ